jgi:hypothetical protein
MASRSSAPDLDALMLTAALSGNLDSLKDLKDRYRGRLLLLARRRAPELADDLQEEVVDETWTVVCCSPGLRYDPSRGSVWEFLVGLLLNAIKTVRDVYRPAV